MSTQAVAPARLAQAKQTITKDDDAKFVSIVRTGRLHLRVRNISSPKTWHTIALFFRKTVWVPANAAKSVHLIVNNDVLNCCACFAACSRAI